MRQVDLVTSEGTVGILASHVPTVFQLLPGLVSFIPEDSQHDKGVSKIESHFGTFISQFFSSSIESTIFDKVPFDHQGPWLQDQVSKTLFGMVTPATLFCGKPLGRLDGCSRVLMARQYVSSTRAHLVLCLNPFRPPRLSTKRSK